jgi:predicted deacetylase
MRIAATKLGKLTTRLLPGLQAVVVSVHDVSPQTQERCEEIRKELSQLGVKACSWLVVPNHHGRGNFLEADSFCDWVRFLAETRHEIVIHGYFHLRERRAHESLVSKFTTRIYTADEGEFYDLSHDEAAALISQAREDFSALGLKPEGFIAPAWLLGAAAEAALREHGLQYTTRLGHVRDLQSRRTFASQSLVWSVRSWWRRWMSLAWNARLYQKLAGNPLLRISIHPVDRDHPAIWRQIRRLVVRALERREALTYERWVTRQRAFQVSPATR